MTTSLQSSFSACPACSVAPAASGLAQETSETGEGRDTCLIMLSVPGVHCAACIAKVERGLLAHPDVSAARVNLSLKRASITAAPGIDAAEMIALVEGLGYEAHELDTAALNTTAANKAGRDLLMRFAVAGFATMNVMLLSVAVWAGAADGTRDTFHWISAMIALPAIAFSGQPFFRNAWHALRNRRLNMDVPITLAILLALGTSLWETALSGHHAYFDAALTLVFFLLAGRYLDHRTRAIARSAAEELTALEVPRAWRLDTDGGEVQVAVSALRVGDHVRVRPGGRMPVDGVIEAGTSELDRSLLTGETTPVFAGVGQQVSAGETNLTGPLTLRATAVGADTSLHRMADLVAVAEAGRANYTSLADRAAKLYAPGVHILSALAFLGWLVGTGDLRTALNIAAAVLIITCPCALGLAVPAVTTAASGRLFKRGMLIKDATALERLAEVDTVVFDKTGTLTTGTPTLEAPEALEPGAMSVAMALAAGSSHPLSMAVVAAGRRRGIAPAEVTGISEVPGYGTEGLWQGQRVRLGRASWTGAAPLAQTAAHLQMGESAPLALTFADTLRVGASEAVQALKAAGKQVLLISGDSEPAVRAMAAQLGIPEWQAGALPDDKVARIRDLAGAGHKVLMVGDGLNDTAALSGAHVSISPASALDAARAASDIVLLGADLSPIADACAIARSATRRIRENFQIATVYNIVAVPLAVVGLATPLIAALAMSSSSIIVSLNALRLKGRA